MIEHTGRRSTAELGRALDLRACLACGQPSEVTGSFELPGTDGVEPYLRTRCLHGHLVVVPAFALPA